MMVMIKRAQDATTRDRYIAHRHIHTQTLVHTHIYTVKLCYIHKNARSQRREAAGVAAEQAGNTHRETHKTLCVFFVYACVFVCCCLGLLVVWKCARNETAHSTRGARKTPHETELKLQQATANLQHNRHGEEMAKL